MAQDVASSSGNAPREAVTETPDIDGERKSVLFLSYNPKIRENDFMNIDAFLREECQMRWAPRSPQPAELAESIARCVSKGCASAQTRRVCISPSWYSRKMGYSMRSRMWTFESPARKSVS